MYLKEHRNDLIAGIVLAIFSIIYLGLTTQVRAFTGVGATPITARTMPQIWGVVLLLCAVILIGRSFARIKKEKAAGGTMEKAATPKEWLSHNYAVVGTFAALFVYAAIFKTVGYVISTILYLAVQIPLLTPKEELKKPKTYVIAVILILIFTFATDYMFVKWFSVRLPKGFWGF